MRLFLKQTFLTSAVNVLDLFKIITLGDFCLFFEEYLLFLNCALLCTLIVYVTS